MAYDPKLVEDKWYDTWMERDYFRATPGDGTPYCITIPPPNITGSLHIGHALNNSVLDAMTRWHRMRGFNTLCLPGSDHAGIATQNVVERELARDGLTRDDIGREGFIEKCWAWRREYGDRIYLQLQKLGCSYDWSRARFTMDESYIDAIHEEFIRWWERGLIYRGARVVNWCPRCRSAISDIEVDSEEHPGKLYHFRYPYAESNSNSNSNSAVKSEHGHDYIVIATTRPETVLGDTAVAVNPADSRYTDKIGRMIRLPLTDREIQLIADEYAKIEFGTGAVKVTPAHDLDDFEAGLRNNLPQIVVIGEDGTMTEAAGPDFAGLDRFEARLKVIEDMERLGLVEKIEDYTVKLPLCDRCGTVLEPLLSEQWFVRMQPELAGPAIEVVETDRIRFVPERYKRIYLDWMGKIKPWCISRQLWWGHRIPVWWAKDGRNAAARTAEEAAGKLGLPAEALHQDEDVLDTWFSSALWPHATLGWPRDTEDLRFYYPTNLLSTAQEILYLWVARMIMTGLDFVGEIPFHDVYVHATVLDEKGERMSKSKGNGIDPLDMIDRYGADALRFALLQQAGKNQDIRFSEERVRLAGQFMNKLWNASRFVLTNLDESTSGSIPEQGLKLVDRWILSRLHSTVEAVNRALASYDMDDAAAAIYRFLWSEFCDWYIELIKPRLREGGEAAATARNVIAHVLEATLRLIHPFIPFITEEIWQELPRSGDSIMLSSYPEAENLPARPDEAAEHDAGVLMDAIRGLRNLRAELGIQPGRRLLGAAMMEREGKPVIAAHAELIADMAKLTTLGVRDSAPSGDGHWVAASIAGGEVYLEIGEALDIEKELERIAKDMASLETESAGVQARLSNPQFLERAAAAVIEKTRAQAGELEEKRAKLEARRALLAG